MSERWQSVAIFAFACLLYCNTLPNEFTNWDDQILVINNAAVRNFDVAAFFTPCAGQTYQPVRELGYALIHAVAGLRPEAYHLVNLLLHASAAVLLLAFLTQLVDSRPAALVATLLFVVHPVNVEAVAWSYNAGALPAQAGNAGKVVATDGEDAGWSLVTSLPDYAHDQTQRAAAADRRAAGLAYFG